MLKKEIRKTYLQKRKTLSADEVFLLSNSIFEQFLGYFNPKKGCKIHLFLSIEKFNEVDTTQFLQFCWENQWNVYVPKMVGEDLISLQMTPDTSFEINNWGIKEPVGTIDCGIKDYDFVITPLLYCDQNGNRVGYGKGFYDRLFLNLNKSVQKIGVNYFPPIDLVDDIYEGDISLDYLVTPTEVLSFTKPS